VQTVLLPESAGIQPTGGLQGSPPRDTLFLLEGRATCCPINRTVSVAAVDWTLLRRSGRDSGRKAWSSIRVSLEVYAVTIAERGRDEASLSTAEMFSWSELPELLAAEDLFECTAGERSGRCGDTVARGDEDDADDDDFDDDDDDDDLEDEDEDDFEDEEDDDEDEDDEDDDEPEEKPKAKRGRPPKSTSQRLAAPKAKAEPPTKVAKKTAKKRGTTKHSRVLSPATGDYVATHRAFVDLILLNIELINNRSALLDLGEKELGMPRGSMSVVFHHCRMVIQALEEVHGIVVAEVVETGAAG
jgi:hypothetical protein